MNGLIRAELANLESGCRALGDTLGASICREAAAVISDLEAIVATYPQTNDGVTVVPGMELWIIDNRRAYRVCVVVISSLLQLQFHTNDGGHTITRLPRRCYSTRAAAEAAKEKE